MQIEDLDILFGQHPEIALARRELQKGKGTHLLLSGLHASARALALAHMRKPLFVVIDNAEEAQYIYGDLRSIEGQRNKEQGTRVFFFPSSKRRRTTDDAAMIQRTETLTMIARYASSMSATPSLNDGLIIVTYPEAIAEPVPPKAELTKSSLSLAAGQEIQQSALGEQLNQLGFERVDFVFQPGQYAIRGSIVDIYSYSHDIPYRLDFFGDEIDSIREFDIEDQLSKSRVEAAEIVGSSNGENGGNGANGASIVDYLTEDFVWVSNSWRVAQYKVESLGLTGHSYDLERTCTLEIAEQSSFTTHSKISFDTMPQPIFHKQFDLLTEDLKRHIDEGYKVYILAEQKKQLDRLEAILSATINGENGDATLNGECPVVMITGHGDVETAVQALKLGAYDFLLKPLDLNRILITTKNALESKSLKQETKQLRKKVAAKGPQMVGESAAITRVRKIIDKVAPTEARVLITGPNGTGKEVVAHLIHEQSARAAGPMVEVNCAAIPSELIESELFGHMKGSFTGAVKDRAGKFEQADGGTLFLDEIGDMSLAAQTKVLRALQESEITRVGSDKAIKVNVRVLAATNKDLQKEIKAGNFREDLFHRLNVIPIQVPSLNDRLEDIPLLVDYFSAQICAEQGIALKTFDPAAIKALQSKDWTGNIRQLRNVVERLIILAGAKITKEDVEAYA